MVRSGKSMTACGHFFATTPLFVLADIEFLLFFRNEQMSDMRQNSLELMSDMRQNSLVSSPIINLTTFIFAIMKFHLIHFSQ
jgi:hypothetical protein